MNHLATFPAALSAHPRPFAPGYQDAVVSVILPTYNEAENLQAVISAVQSALRDIPHHEILVVDDNSPDGTWRLADDLCCLDSRIRCHRRLHQRGLASAIFDGLARARGEFLVVIDADLQHDPEVIPSLVAALEQKDVAVASRYTSGGATASWSWLRRCMSRFATSLGQWASGLQITDPMSGFFALRRGTFRSVEGQLRPRGFKALLEILSKTPEARVTEIPYTFGPRRAGTSKLGAEVMLSYLLSLVELRFPALISPQSLRYGVVGLSGVGVQLVAVAILQQFFSGSIALAMAILTAMVSNFTLNNAWTFRDSKLTQGAFAAGLMRFVGVSSVGAVLNHVCTLGIHRLTGLDLVAASLAGIAVATLWNYHVNRLWTWKNATEAALGTERP